MAWFRPITKERAEILEGKKLDGRRKYFEKTEEGLAATRGTDANPWGYIGYEKAFVIDKFSTECSGCDGFGCFECGGKGKRRDYMHTPVSLEEWIKETGK